MLDTELLRDLESEELTLELETAAVFEPLLQPSRWKAAHGGRASAKSHFFADLLIEYALMRPGLRAICIREHQITLKNSVKQLLEDKIRSRGLVFFFPIFNTHIVTPGGGIIIFIGMKNHTADSVKSFEGFDIAWVEEAQTFSQRSFDLLYPTIRKDHSEIWFSWNPNLPTDPVDKFFRGGERPPDSIIVKANYQDNPWCPKVMKDAAEYDRQRDFDRYAHIWLGDYNKKSEARVFKNWKIEEVPDPASVQVLYFGADWGYSIDPTVLIASYIQGRKLYIWREAYQLGCEIDNTPALFDALEPSRPGLARQWPITADSSRPETISFMQRNGYPRMRKSIKGAKSIEEGIKFLQSYDIIVDPSCINTIDELTSFSYKKDPLTDDILPILEDKKNHVIDALRYAVERARRKKMGLL